MTVLHNKIYNPKIDYLICKQLVKTLPERYDEDQMRICYRDNKAEKPYEQDLINIKAFFERNDVLQCTNNTVKDLYVLCAHEDLILIDEDIAITVKSDMREIAAFVNKIDCKRNVLFQILFLLHYLVKNNLPIIPYASLCGSMFYAISAGEDLDAAAIYSKLQKQAEKYLTKHTIEDGEKCIKLFNKYAEDFLAESDAVKVGFYGSYARGNANEYSDFDILTVFTDEKVLPLCKIKALEFWRSKLPIKVDVAVINQSNFDDLPQGIRRSVKFV